MGMFKRAVLSVTRRRGKTLLLFAFLLVMATFVLTGLSIWRASEIAQRDLRQRLGGKFAIQVDWDSSPYVVNEVIMENVVDEETGKQSTAYLIYSTVQLLPEDIAAIKAIPGVKYCSARQEHLAPVEELSLFPGTIAVEEKLRRQTKVYGVCGTEEDELFTSGVLTLTEGRHISGGDIHTAVISRDLAERNELNIGDYITAHSYCQADDSYTGQEIRIQIVGLFTPEEIEQFHETIPTYDKIQNRVFVDLQTANDLAGDAHRHGRGFDVLQITVDDPQDMDRIIDAVRRLPDMDWAAFTIDTDSSAYESAAAPLAALSTLVVILLAVIIAVSVTVLALLLTLWTKTRIHEIGVLLSVGIRKSSVIGQHLVEVLLIAALAFGLSYFTSSAMAGQVGDRLVKGYMQAEEETGENVAAAAVDFGADALSTAPLPAEKGIQVSVALDSFALLCLIGAAIISAAVSVSSVTVMRLKPREILSKMS